MEKCILAKVLFIVANATVSLITGHSSHTDVRLHKRKRDMKERKK